MLLCSLERGTGLALFITKAIVEAHNSRINAENNRTSGGKRSTFSVIAPVRTAATSAARAQKSELDPESLKDILRETSTSVQ